MQAGDADKTVEKAGINVAFITAALTAEASHMTVQIIGNAASSSTPVGG